MFIERRGVVAFLYFVNFMLSLIITKIFSKKSIYDFKNKNSIQDIYSINNDLSNKIEQIFIQLEIVLNNKIEINYKNIRDFSMSVLTSLIDNKIILKNLIYSQKEKKKRTFLYIENLKRDDTIFLSLKKYEIYERPDIEKKKNIYILTSFLFCKKYI